MLYFHFLLKLSLPRLLHVQGSMGCSIDILDKILFTNQAMNLTKCKHSFCVVAIHYGVIMRVVVVCYQVIKQEYAH